MFNVALMNPFNHHPWARWAGVVLLSLLIASAAAFWRLHAERRAQASVESLEMLQSALRASPEPPADTTTRGQDYAIRLPTFAAVEPIVRDLQRFSASEGVTLASLEASARVATPQSLGRTEIAVTLRGEYPKLKATLAQVLDRYPHLVLQKMNLRRVSGPTALEGNVSLLLLSRPLLASSGS